jgi:hypothetical protein
VQTASSAWPQITIADPDRKDNVIDTVSAEILAPVPQTATRSLTFRITQDVRSQNPNFNITGFNVYYKLSTATYWKKASHTFPGGYSPGTVVSTPFTGSIGTTGQPAVYTVAIRLTYSDGSESTRQFVASFAVEDASYSAPSINLLYGIAVRSVTGITKTGIMNTTDLNIITEDQAPPGAVANPLDMTLGIDTLFALGPVGNNKGIGIVLYPPAAADRANWQGVRVYYRPVVPGKNPTLSKIDFTSATDITLIGNTTRTYRLPDLLHYQAYEMILVPLVPSGNTDFVESNNCIMGVGYAHLNTGDPDYPGIFTANGDGNWRPRWNFQQFKTITAKNAAGTIFASGDPVVNVTGVFGVNKWNRYEFDPRYGQKQRISEFIEISFDRSGIANYESLYVYRRDYFGNAGASSTSEAKYYGVGRWERVIATATGSNTQTINIRLPASYRQFNRYYELVNYKPYYGTEGTGLYNDYTSIGVPANVVPIKDNASGVQLLLVVKTTTSLSTKGVLIKLRNFDYNVARTNMLMNNSFPVRPEVIDYATTVNIRDSDFQAGYDRRLSDARTSIPEYNIYYRGCWLPTDSTGQPRLTYGYDLISGYPAVDSGSAVV